MTEYFNKNKTLSKLKEQLSSPKGTKLLIEVKNKKTNLVVTIPIGI